MVVFLAGGALVLSGTSAGATLRPGTPVPGPGSGADAAEAQAVGLLTVAARAARAGTYRGMQYVSTWRAGSATEHVFEVRHDPRSGLLVSDPASPAPAFGMSDPGVSPDLLDDRLLGLLAAHYVLSVGPVQAFEGRVGSVVEARRAGSGLLAARFVVDRDSGLVLQRELFDAQGTLLRSSGFVSLTVTPAGGARPGPLAVPAPVFVLAAAAGERVGQPGLAALRSEGWLVPPSLPHDLDLFEARLRTAAGAPVLHLAYSDGLTTVSLFVQPGHLGHPVMPGFRQQRWGGRPVLVATGGPNRVVWAGGGRVWTLVSDAPVETLTAVVTSLPQERAAGTGLLTRLRAGIGRVLTWLNPFG